MPRLLVITGPTAVGKTEISVAVARYFNTSVISCDSRQFYKEMQIGTAAPDAAVLEAVPHYFVGHLSIHDPYNVSQYEQDVLQCLPVLFAQSDTVVMTGGSGLYIDGVVHGIDVLPNPDPAVRDRIHQFYLSEGLVGLQEWLQQLDPVYFQQVDKNNPNRLKRAIEICLSTGVRYSELRLNRPKVRSFEVIKVCLTRPREVLYQRINERVETMLALGLEEEARQLYPFRDFNALNTVGYRELFAYFEGRITREQAITDIKTHSRRYAKRQLTWFRRDPEYHWIDLEQPHVGWSFLPELDKA
ncbi:MAG: tRNA (adenosine(37)-N6)-dimethylallyltransferase MiaA [Bacteroidales bacterium]|nr:tRNA (adenosine(37)-N6)-dimethylallyltransferase MiaA [Bacteroidales bacterium]